jgi:predicted neuraminidase
VVGAHLWGSIRDLETLLGIRFYGWASAVIRKEYAVEKIHSADLPNEAQVEHSVRRSGSPRPDLAIATPKWWKHLARGAIILLAVCCWVFPRSDRFVEPTTEFRFAPPPQFVPHEVPVFYSTFVDGGGPVGIAHSPSICELPNGRLGAVWYAGSREGGRDVAIWYSKFARGIGQVDGDGRDQDGENLSSDDVARGWSEPQVLMDVHVAIEELERKIRKVGNPVIFGDQAGGVHLAYVSVAMGGWSASSLNIKSSWDGGNHWEHSQRLTLSPFANISELVRCPPAYTDSGEVVLPIYHEFLGKFPQLLWLRPGAQRMAWSKTRMAGGRRLLQPVIVPQSPAQAVAYYRNGTSGGALMAAESEDGGLSWGTPETLELPNNDSSLSALRLTDGSILVAFSDDWQGRSNMTLAISRDGRHNWRRLITLDHEPDARFAYPYLIRDRDGMIHLVYSWKMTRIRHVMFNEPWLSDLDGRLAEVSER